MITYLGPRTCLAHSRCAIHVHGVNIPTVVWPGYICASISLRPHAQSHLLVLGIGASRSRCSVIPPLCQIIHLIFEEQPHGGIRYIQFMNFSCTI